MCSPRCALPKETILMNETMASGKILNFNDHQYTKKRSNKSTDDWRCRIRSDASTVIHPPTDHSHIPAKVDKLKNMCKKRAREETTPISQIHKQESVKCSLTHNDISFLLSYLSIDSSFYRERLKNYPELPKSVSDITLTGKWGTVPGRNE
ncbi:unnamed protein product, partial [Didymodactylos carnosus]